MRRTTSIVLALTFILVSVTGLSMALAPRHGPPGGPPPGMDEVGDEGFRGPHGLGGPGGRAEPLFPKQLHEWGAYLMVVAGLLHLGLNYRPLLRHLGQRRTAWTASPQN